MTTVQKAAEQSKIELPKGYRRLSKPTKVVATRIGYADAIREPGDVFYASEGTILGPNSWFEPVHEDTATNADIDAVEEMSIAEIKVELAQKGIDFSKANKKTDLAALLLKARSAQGGEDLA